MVSLLEDRRRILLNTPHVEEVSDGIASFKTDVPTSLKKCVVDIDPIQDLHGYDRPWPAGGGKNLLNVDLTSQTINGVTFTVREDGTINVNGTATAKINVNLNSNNKLPIGGDTVYMLSGCPKGGSASGYRLGLPYLGWDLGNGVSGTIPSNSNGIAFIEIQSETTLSNLIFKPMVCLSTATNPTTFEPYSNICPISGLTEMKVEKCGKNLLDAADFTLVRSSQRTIGMSLFNIPCPGNFILSLRVENNTTTTQSVFTLRNGSWSNYISLARIAIPAGATGLFQTKVMLTTVPIDYLYSYISTTDNDDATITITNIQLELGSTATPYEPYTGETYDITFPTEAGTVYGGTLDMLSGVLTVDRAMVDMGTLAWVYVGSGDTRYTTSSLSSVIKDSGTRRTPLVCSAYRVLSNGEAYDPTADGVIYTSGTGNIYVQDSSVVASTTGFITKVTGQTLVYPLATPTTYQFDPHILKAIRGTNNIWSDAGDTTVRFWTH